MNEYLGLFAKNIGLLGILLSLAAVILRVVGLRHFNNIESLTLLQGGMALMLVSCVIQLNFLIKR